MSNEDPNVTGAPPAHLEGAGDVRDRYSDIFFAAVETTRMPMIVTDPYRPDHPIIFCNHAFTQMTGYASEEIIGRNCRFLQGRDTDTASVAEVRDAVAEGREVNVEILNYRKDGSSFWNALFVSPVYDRDGKLIYFFGSQLDVSRRRDAEDALRQAQKMEAIGNLTGGIAHDFNNLLQVVLGFTDIADNAARRGDADKAQKAHAQVRAAAERAAALTSQLLAFSRKQRLEGRVVSLNALADDLSRIGDRTLGDGVTVVKEIDCELCNARLDPVQAHTALLNVAINARDAMGGKGTLTVRTFEHTCVPGQRTGRMELRPGRYAAISVTDTGTGMSPEVAERVLDPFFSTKGEGKGTGLGLSMVYGFMKQSEGALRIDTAPGSGTTVTLFFPATDDAVAKPADSVVTAAVRGKERILVVEDRREVADLAVAILQDQGYGTATAADGHEALALVRNDGRFDLLFSDVVMPGELDGVALAREAVSLVPGIRVLLTTGYCEGSMRRDDDHKFEVLHKPYRPADLARRVRMVLDAA